MSLRWFGGKIADAHFVLCTTGKLPDETEDFFRRHGAEIVLVERFSTEHGPSNKIKFLENDSLDKWENILLLDCDTVIVQDPSLFLETEGLSVKIADLPTVKTEQFRELFDLFELDMPSESYIHEVAGVPCLPYFNSGVVLLNSKWRERFVKAWVYYNNAIIKNWDVLKLSRFFTDQASLTLAVVSTSIPFSLLDNALNFPGHLPAHKYPDAFYKIDPYIIHYHGFFDNNGYIKKTVIGQVNRRIETFNSRLRAEKALHENLLERDSSWVVGREREPKVVVGSGWWCDNEAGDWDIGHESTRSIPFFSLWLSQVVKYLSPHKIVITDSSSPLKPDYKAYDLIEWVELDKNYGHANDIRTGVVDTKYSGFTRSVLLGCMYALSCDADYYIYVEQDCLIKGHDFLQHAIGDNEEDILIGMQTDGGIGLDGKQAAKIKQQSLMIVKRSAMERFISGLLSAEWTDGDVSPEITMGRVLKPIGTLSIPFGRSRPIDFELPCYYVQHFTGEELEIFLSEEGMTDLWARLARYYFESI